MMLCGAAHNNYFLFNVTMCAKFNGARTNVLRERRLLCSVFRRVIHQAYFHSKNETVAVFHGIDILKMNLERFKVNEKDFVILNATRRSIIVIEVKRTLGAGDSIEKSIEQLSEAKEDLEAWFGTEGLEHWAYIPMIYTEKIEPVIDCDRCNQHVIEGNVK